MNRSPMQLLARCGRLAAALLMAGVLQLAAS
jgi:hypothetical protein